MEEERMMTVIIEETVSQEFRIPMAFESEVEQMYRDGKLVLEPGELQSAQYMIKYDDGEETGWCDLK